MQKVLERFTSLVLQIKSQWGKVDFILTIRLKLSKDGGILQIQWQLNGGFLDNIESEVL